MSSQDMLDLDDQQAGPGQLAQGGCHIPTVARAKTSSGITFRSDSRVMMSEMHDSSRHVRRCRAELNVPSPVKAVAVTMSHYEALVLDSRRLFVVWPVDAASDAPAAACSSGAAFVIVRTYCLALLVSLSQKRRLPGALRQVSPWPGDCGHCSDAFEVQVQADKLQRRLDIEVHGSFSAEQLLDHACDHIHVAPRGTQLAREFRSQRGKVAATELSDFSTTYVPCAARVDFFCAGGKRSRTCREIRTRITRFPQLSAISPRGMQHDRFPF